MSNGIEVTGLEDFAELLQDMTITEADEKKAMTRALEIPYRQVVDNTPVQTGLTKRSVKKYVKKDGLATVGNIKVNNWRALFTEFGTSKDKSHVGWFNRSIDKTTEQFILNLYYALLEKAK